MPRAIRTSSGNRMICCAIRLASSFDSRRMKLLGLGRLRSRRRQAFGRPSPEPRRIQHARPAATASRRVLSRVPSAQGLFFFPGYRTIPVLSPRSHVPALMPASLGGRRAAAWRSLFVPLKLPLSPMMLFAGRFEHALDVPIQRLHDPDPRKHRWPT
jgi:hypothetical protein